MAYYPYFRGKQFELLAIREKAELIAEAEFIPVIEPVRESLTGLERALDALHAAGAGAIVIINPKHGDHSEDGSAITELMRDKYLEFGFTPGILLSDAMGLGSISGLLDQIGAPEVALIHAGFDNDVAVNSEIENRDLNVVNLFIEKSTGVLYRRRFNQGPKVLIADGFIQEKNSNYPDVERFTDLHVTHIEQGFEGFGDFSIVGDHYSDSGGPAWAVAIHITFVDPERDGEMFVYHFKSDTNDTPVDPGGKFMEAVAKLVAEVNSPQTKVFQSTAIEEFRELYRRRHFPGLGYVKKLSIIHHLETVAQFEFNRQSQG